MMSQVVELNIGGAKYTTTRQTLSVSPYFEALLSGNFDITKAQNRVFVDRNGKSFEYCLNYMQGYTVKDIPERYLNMVLQDAVYYGLEDLECGIIEGGIKLHELHLEYKDKGRWDIINTHNKYTGGSYHGTIRGNLPYGYSLKIRLNDSHRIVGKDILKGYDDFINYVIYGELRKGYIVGNITVIRD